MRIPFTGTGITLYVIQIADYGNFTIALDGGQPTVSALSYRANASYNITLYDVQSLSHGDHYVTVEMQDWTGGGSLIGSLIFDYAAVNDTTSEVATSSTSTSSTAAATSSSASQHPRNIATGAIIGGVMGGLALVVAVVLVLFCRRKRTSEPAPPEPFPPFVTSSLTLGGAENFHLKPPLRSPESFPLVTTSVEASDVLPRGPSRERLNVTKSESSLFVATSQSPVAIASATHSTSQPEVLTSGRNLSPPLAQASSHPGSNFSDGQLTDEQVDLVRSLWNARVAAADIARVIERMKSRVSDEDVTGAVGGPNLLGGLPPSYDSLRRQ